MRAWKIGEAVPAEPCSCLCARFFKTAHLDVQPTNRSGLESEMRATAELWRNSAMYRVNEARPDIL